MINNGQDPLISKEDNIINAVTEVTEEELRGAFQKIGGLATVVRISWNLNHLYSESAISDI